MLFDLLVETYNRLADYHLSTGRAYERVWHFTFPIWGHKVRRHPDFQGECHVAVTFRQLEGGQLTYYQAMIDDASKDVITLSDLQLRKAILARLEDALEEASDNPLGLPDLGESLVERQLRAAKPNIELWIKRLASEC